MKTAAHMMLLVAASISGSLLFAAEPAPTTASAAKTATPADSAKKAEAADKDKKSEPDQDKKADAEKDKKAEATAKTGDDKSAADKAGDKDSDKSSPQRFIPSEQVRADFDVSFPVDI
jgi:hypothetical protein